MESKWDNKLTSLQKLHNFLSIYLIDLKSSKKVASWSDAPYSITKLKAKSKQKIMLLWNKGTQIEQTWLNPHWFLCKKLHNFLSFYLINLKISNKIASWNDAPYPIYKTQKKKIKTKKYKDLKQDLQVLLWMLGLRFLVLTLFFSILHKFWLHFPMKSYEGLNISINPIFPVIFSFIFCFDYLLGCRFCWSCSFLFYGTMSNIWRSSSSSSSSIVCPPFLFANFFFPLPPPFVQFVLARIMLGS